MSRIGKNPVVVPNGVNATINGNIISVKGKKGELSFAFHNEMQVEIADNTIIVTRKNEEKLAKSLHGLTRTLINNMVQGVNNGFEKRLEIHGVGYKMAVAGSTVNLSLGFSHPVKMEAPAGITVAMDAKAKNELVISGIDKQAVGQFAANIRSLKKPEPYKGKGIRYKGERIVRKAGKTSKK